MAKIAATHEVKFGDDGVFILREPTRKEWNSYHADMSKVRGNQVKLRLSKAKCDLFDKLVTDIKNVEDDAGEITVDTLDRIPPRIKEDIIDEALRKRAEGDEDLDEKN